MPTVEISQVHFERLKQLAEPLVDTADSVVGRLLEAYREDGSAMEEAGGARRDRSSQPRPATRDRKRARKGERTPTEAFYEPLLHVLKEAGGELSAAEAIDRIGRVMAGQLNEVDRSRLPSGELRWRNGARWARQRLENQGKLDTQAPYGVWKLKGGSRQ